MNIEEENEITALKKEMALIGEKNIEKEKKERYIFLRRKQKAERRQIQQETITIRQNKSLNEFNWSWLWLIIPLGIIALIVLSVLYVPSEPYNPNYDPRIENCGPGETWC